MTRAKGINWASDFAVLAHRYEERIAVSDRHGTVTYGALFARATSIAQALSQRGIGPRSVVATMFRNDRHAVAGMLATMLTGSTEVPLNPALSQADREHCCSVAGVEMVLTSETLADSSLNDLGAVMTVEAISPAISDVIMLPNCDPNSPARIVFTSGAIADRWPPPLGRLRRRGLARNAWARISLSMRCRPQSMPSASTSRQTRLAP